MSQEREQSLTSQRKRRTDEMKKSRSKETKQRKRSEGELRRDASSALWGQVSFRNNLFKPKRKFFRRVVARKRCVFLFIIFIYAIAEKIMVSLEPENLNIWNRLFILDLQHNNTPPTLH
jgi:hypothetical protein